MWSLIRCRRVRSRLTEYVLGELPQESRPAIAAHLERCRECRVQEEAERQTQAMLAALRAEPVDPPYDWPAVRQRLCGLQSRQASGWPVRMPAISAAGLALALALGHGHPRGITKAVNLAVGGRRQEAGIGQQTESNAGSGLTQIADRPKHTEGNAANRPGTAKERNDALEDSGSEIVHAVTQKQVSFRPTSVLRHRLSSHHHHYHHHRAFTTPIYVASASREAAEAVWHAVSHGALKGGSSTQVAETPTVPTGYGTSPLVIGVILSAGDTTVPHEYVAPTVTVPDSGTPELASIDGGRQELMTW